MQSRTIDKLSYRFEPKMHIKIGRRTFLEALNTFLKKMELVRRPCELFLFFLIPWFTVYSTSTFVLLLGSLDHTLQLEAKYQIGYGWTLSTSIRVVLMRDGPTLQSTKLTAFNFCTHSPIPSMVPTISTPVGR